jgi:hypothetical protein
VCSNKDQALFPSFDSRIEHGLEEKIGSYKELRISEIQASNEVNDFSSMLKQVL